MTSAITDILKNSTPVQVLVGLNIIGDKFKVYPVVAPQGEKPPYMTVYKAGNDPLTSLTKDLASGLDYPRVTVNSWDVNFRTTELMGEAAREALDNISGVAAGYTIARIWLVDDRDGYDPETKMYTHSSTFGVELARLEGNIYEMITAGSFAGWGGLWNWSANGNAFPSVNVTAGKIWVTVGAVTLSGNLIPDGTIMIAKQNGADSYDEFTFNL